MSNKIFKNLLLKITIEIKKTLKKAISVNRALAKLNDVSKIIPTQLPKIYSKDLIEILFMHPYTKIEFLVDGLNITRQTASKYLIKLEEIGLIKPIQIKNSKFFINSNLFDILRKGMS